MGMWLYMPDEGEEWACGLYMPDEGEEWECGYICQMRVESGYVVIYAR